MEVGDVRCGDVLACVRGIVLWHLRLGRRHQLHYGRANIRIRAVDSICSCECSETKATKVALSCSWGTTTCNVRSRLVILPLPYRCRQQDDPLGELQSLFCTLFYLWFALVLQGVAT